MIKHEKLDAHTIILDMGFLECVDSNLEAFSEKICKKIATLVENPVSTGQDIEANFGIPIVNKRIFVTLTTLVGDSACRHSEDPVTMAKALDMAAKEVGASFIGGYPVLVNKGMTRTNRNLILFIPQVLSQTEHVCSSVNIGSTKADIGVNAVGLMGRTVAETAETIGDHNSFGYAKLVMFCNAPDDGPFMAGAFHGMTESEAIVNVGVSDPGVVKVALTKVRDANFEALYETTKKAVFKIIHVDQLVAQEASRRMGIPFEIIGLSLAPTPSMGDSVAKILEEIGLECVGAPGTTAALAMLNDQVKKGDVMASSYMDGLNGAFIPISEDQGVINAVSAGASTTEKLGTMTYVCSIGLDMIATPGGTPSSAIAGIIADEAIIGMANQKATIACLILVVGKEIGRTVEFNGLLDCAPAMPVSTFSCRRSVTRGGRIPVPIYSFKG